MHHRRPSCGNADDHQIARAQAGGLHIIRRLRRLPAGLRRRDVVDAPVFEPDNGFSAGQGAHFAPQLCAKNFALVAHDLGDEVQSSVFQGLQGAFGAAFRKGADHQHRHGVGLHQPLQGFQPTQPGHFHIQGHDVGFHFIDNLQRRLPIGGGGHHLDVLLLFQMARRIKVESSTTITRIMSLCSLGKKFRP